MKLVLDTNIYYSAIGFDNIIYKMLMTILADTFQFRLYMSQQIWNELESKLFSVKFDKNTKNQLTQEQKIEFLQLVKSNVIFCQPEIKVNICRDPEDNKFLELAVTIQADYIVTGDDDLLELQEFEGCLIVKPSQFLELAFKDNY